MKIKANVAFNTGQDGKIRIIKFDDDNKVYNIDKQVAFVFLEISKSSTYQSILDSLINSEKNKSSTELKKFLDDVIEDFTNLGFLE